MSKMDQYSIQRTTVERDHRATKTPAQRWNVVGHQQQADSCDRATYDFGYSRLRDGSQDSRGITVAERLSYVGDVAPRLAFRSTITVKPRNLARPFGARLVTLKARLFFQLFILLFSILCAPPAFAQTTQQVRIADKVWGFDGRVMNGQFMPLSIELDNLSDEPIEAQATLRSMAGMLRETGGTATQSIFLGPHSRRWVQFYPYIVGMTSSWRFELRTEDETLTFDPIDQPRSEEHTLNSSHG